MVTKETAVRTPWCDFPEVVIHSSIARLKSLSEYQAAKHGNAIAARIIVSELFKSDRFQIEANYVVPVIQVDRGHFNAIPIAFGAHVAKTIDARLWLETYQANKVDHTGATAQERFFKQPI